MLETLTAVFGNAMPAVATLLAKAAETVVENWLGCALEDSDERRRAREAYHQAMQEWLIALVRNFQSLGYDDNEIGAFFADYMESLPLFLADEEASEELLRPFTGPEPEPRLDAERLLAPWQALSLPALPEDFNARGACTAYVKALNRKRIVTPELALPVPGTNRPRRATSRASTMSAEKRENLVSLRRRTAAWLKTIGGNVRLAGHDALRYRQAR